MSGTGVDGRHRPRVLVLGDPGAGKTSLARRLARRLEVPAIEADGLLYGPGWEEPPAEQVVPTILAGLPEDEGWVLDLWIPAATHERAVRAIGAMTDAVVWLDVPRRVAAWSLIRRNLGRMWRREPVWNGNRETLRGLVLNLWWLFVHAGQRRRTHERLAGRGWVRLRTRAAADAWAAQAWSPRRS